MDDLPRLFEKLSEPVLFIIILIAVIFVIVRPLMKFLVDFTHHQKIKKIETQKEDELKEDDEFQELMGLFQEHNKQDSDSEKIRRLAKSDPVKAKELIKAWLQENQ